MPLTFQPVLNPDAPPLPIPGAFGNIPVPSPVPGSMNTIPTTPVAAPAQPTFNDIVNRLNSNRTVNPVREVGGGATLERSLGEIAPSTGLRPEIQRVLDLIQQRTTEARSRGVSEAQALAVRRGIAGSSTEQFGTQTAASEAEKAGRDAETNILLENAKREQALQDLRARILADRSTQEGTVGAQVGIQEAQLGADLDKALAGLTSDEIASLRNMDLANRTLALQQLLGERGLAIESANIDASKDIARDAARNNLLTAGIGAVVPSVLQKILGGGGGAAAGGGGGAGGLASLFSLGLGGGGAGGGAAGGAAASGAGAAAAAPGLGIVPAAGLAIGGIAAYQSLSDKGKAIVAPLVNPVATVKTVTKAIDNAFGGGRHTDAKGSDVWRNGLNDNEIATQLGTDVNHGVSFDSNQPGSAIYRYNEFIAGSFTPAMLMSRYSAGTADDTRYTTDYDKENKRIYDNASEIFGPGMTEQQFDVYFKDNESRRRAQNDVSQAARFGYQPPPSALNNPNHQFWQTRDGQKYFQASRQGNHPSGRPTFA